MSLNRLIEKTLKDLNCPVRFGEYRPAANEEPAKIYYTYNFTTLGDAFSDNAPGIDRHLIQLHLFFPITHNAISQIKMTKKALFGAGFSYPKTVKGSDANGGHIIFECEYLEVLDGVF